MLNLNNLKVTFKDKVALDMGREINIEPGDRVGIIGSNGAGKTTLLKAILGMVPYDGHIKRDLALDDIAVHMQENQYAETVPVGVIIEMILGTKIKNDPKLLEMIKFFDFEDSLKKRWKHLSGGQKQRLTLILVMCQDSPLTLFDEVTSGLDFETRHKLMGKIVDWYKNKETSILIVSHYYEELENMADKILFLDKGKVIDFGNKRELFQKYCGQAVIVFKESEKALEIAQDYEKIQAPLGNIAISCKTDEEEGELARNLSQGNINYRRSDNDIEIMTINAKTRFYDNYERKV